jgi:hypothetical protein
MDITAALVIEQGRLVVDTPHTISDSLVKQSLDPEKHVELRKHTGGTAKKEVLRMAKAADKRLASDAAAIGSFEKKLSNSLAELRKEADKVRGK